MKGYDVNIQMKLLERLCIKVGRGQGDGDLGTWRTRDEGLGDVKYRTQGRGDVKNWDAGDPG